MRSLLPMALLIPILAACASSNTDRPAEGKPAASRPVATPMERIAAYLDDAAALVNAYRSGYAENLTLVQRSGLVARFQAGMAALRARHADIDARLADAVKHPACAAARGRLGRAIDACLAKYATSNGFWLVLARLTGPVGQGEGAPVNMVDVRSIAEYSLKPIEAEVPLMAGPTFRVDTNAAVPVYINIAPHPKNGFMYRPGRFYFFTPSGTAGVAIKELCNGLEGLRNAMAIRFADGRKGWVDWRHAWEFARITAVHPAYDNPRLDGNPVGSTGIGEIVAVMPGQTFGFRGVDRNDVLPLRYPDGRVWYVQAVAINQYVGDVPYQVLKTAQRLVCPESRYTTKNGP